MKGQVCHFSTGELLTREEVSVSAVSLRGWPVGTQWELRDLSGAGGGKGENKSMGEGWLVSDEEGTDER